MSRVHGQRYDREESSWTEQITCDMCKQTVMERAVLAEFRGRANGPAFLKNEPHATLLSSGSKLGSDMALPDDPPPMDLCSKCAAVMLDFLRERGLAEPTEVTRVYTPCPQCRGDGYTDDRARGIEGCQACLALGWAHDSRGDPVVVEMKRPRRCRNPDCRRGNIPLERCPECKGKMVIDDAF